MRNEPLFSAVFWLTLMLWVFTTPLAHYLKIAPAEVALYREIGAYLSGVIFSVMCGIVLVFVLIYFQRKDRLRYLGPHKGPTSDSSMGPLPNFWVKPVIADKPAQIDASKFPRLAHMVALAAKAASQGSPSSDTKEVFPIARAFLDVLRTLNTIPKLPASSKLGAHNNNTLIEHCCRVAEKCFDVFEDFDYQGIPAEKKYDAVPARHQESEGRGLIEHELITLPLLVLTGLAHDIGKLRTFKTRDSEKGFMEVVAVIGDHGPVGAQMLSRLPGVIASPYPFMHRMMMAISHYHHPKSLPQDKDDKGGFHIRCDATQGLMQALIDADKAACADERCSPEDYVEDELTYNPLGARPLAEAIQASIIPSLATTPYNIPQRPGHIGHVFDKVIYVDLRRLHERVARYLDVQHGLVLDNDTGIDALTRAIIEFLFSEKLLVCQIGDRKYPPLHAIFAAELLPPPMLNKEQKKVIEKLKTDNPTMTEEMIRENFSAEIEAKATKGPSKDNKKVVVRSMILLSATHPIFASAHLRNSSTKVLLGHAVMGEATSVRDEDYEEIRNRILERRRQEIEEDVRYRESRRPPKLSDAHEVVIKPREVPPAPVEEPAVEKVARSKKRGGKAGKDEKTPDMLEAMESSTQEKAAVTPPAEAEEIIDAGQYDNVEQFAPAEDISSLPTFAGLEEVDDSSYPSTSVESADDDLADEPEQGHASQKSLNDMTDEELSAHIQHESDKRASEALEGAGLSLKGDDIRIKVPGETRPGKKGKAKSVDVAETIAAAPLDKELLSQPKPDVFGETSPAITTQKPGKGRTSGGRQSAGGTGDPFAAKVPNRSKGGGANKGAKSAFEVPSSAPPAPVPAPASTAPEILTEPVMPATAGSDLDVLSSFLNETEDVDAKVETETPASASPGASSDDLRAMLTNPVNFMSSGRSRIYEFVDGFSESSDFRSFTSQNGKGAPYIAMPVSSFTLEPFASALREPTVLAAITKNTNGSVPQVFVYNEQDGQLYLAVKA